MSCVVIIYGWIFCGNLTGFNFVYYRENAYIKCATVSLTTSGFSKDQFNFGDGRSNLGNRVKLVSETRTYDCDPHKDGNTQFQITCDTR